MVSPNLNRIGDEFNDMVEERDWMGYIALAGAGAIGGVLAEMFHDRIAPRLNQPAEPTSSRGLLGSFGIKGAAAVLLGMLSVRTSGSAAMMLAVLGIGAAIDAGVDLIEAGDRLRTASPSQTRSGSSSAQTARRARQSRPSPQPNRPTPDQRSQNRRSSSARPSI